MELAGFDMVGQFWHRAALIFSLLSRAFHSTIRVSLSYLHANCMFFHVLQSNIFIEFHIYNIRHLRPSISIYSSMTSLRLCRRAELLRPRPAEPTGGKRRR